MKQLATRESQGGHPATPKTNSLVNHSTTDSILIKEVETTVTTRERIYAIPSPVCMHCGETKTRIIGMLFECLSEDCPGHDPDPAAAIPLKGEQKEVIDVEPIRRAA